MLKATHIFSIKKYHYRLKLENLFFLGQKKNELLNKEFRFTKSNSPTQQHIIISSFTEGTARSSLPQALKTSKCLRRFYQEVFFDEVHRRILANIVLQDMCFFVRAWRQIRGYPTTGATTHTNARTAKKNKILLNFRISQFEQEFGKKRRNIYPTLVKAEYNNRLWYYTFYLEWLQAHVFAKKMARAGTRVGAFNPAILATNQVNGFERSGQAAKVGKAKKLFKVFTLGVPLLFAKYIYPVFTPYGFPRIILKDEVNKQLGKKLRRRQRKDD